MIAKLCSLASGAVVAAGAVLAVAPPADATTPACGNTSLTVSATRTQGATGHGSLVLLFRNKTTHTCSIYGYPGLDALNASHAVLKHARRTLHGFAGGSLVGLRTVYVRAGHYASASVEWLNFNPTTAGPCTFSHYIATTPANTTHTVDFARSVSVCNLQVHPTVPGTTGNWS